GAGAAGAGAGALDPMLRDGGDALEPGSTPLGAVEADAIPAVVVPPDAVRPLDPPPPQPPKRTAHTTTPTARWIAPTMNASLSGAPLSQGVRQRSQSAQAAYVK
ncbi:MAG: hypothetical protein KF878_38355, partial [Planctomycetes bacterium]|nr:hypothetical protein [Planctomycetota bacterium]